MSLRLFVAPGLAALHEFDDVGVVSDVGSVFRTDVEGHPLAPSAGGEFKLRRINQWVRLASDATVAITPIADGSVLTDQRYQLDLLVQNGQAQRLEVPCSARGRRFSARLEVLSGSVSWGEAELLMLPKRSITGGDL